MATRKKRNSYSRTNKQIKFWASLIVAVIAAIMQQTGKPLSEELPSEESLKNVSIVSVYDGDTFKINLNCSLAVYCEKVPVRVLGVDCPEIKGKTEKEKQLAQKAKTFTKNFLDNGPIALTECSRDKYFRLLCKVQNSQGQNLTDELIKHNLGYAYYGGTKSDRYH